MVTNAALHLLLEPPKTEAASVCFVAGIVNKFPEFTSFLRFHLRMVIIRKTLHRHIQSSWLPSGGVFEWFCVRLDQKGVDSRRGCASRTRFVSRARRGGLPNSDLVNLYAGVADFF